jgi:hypothetical protein
VTSSPQQELKIRWDTDIPGAFTDADYEAINDERHEFLDEIMAQHPDDIVLIDTEIEVKSVQQQGDSRVSGLVFGPMVIIAGAGLLVNSIGVAISVLSYWAERRGTATAEFTFDGDRLILVKKNAYDQNTDGEVIEVRDDYYVCKPPVTAA